MYESLSNCTCDAPDNEPAFWSVDEAMILAVAWFLGARKSR